MENIFCCYYYFLQIYLIFCSNPYFSCSQKDTWSEEEERLLVEAHEQVGNRWAEIAKRIPGRSENSIKNHWNATKRRQNSRRKSKRKSNTGSRSNPSILQQYIQSRTLTDQKPPTTPPSNPSEPAAATYDSSFSTMTQMDECMQTMQSFYDNFSDEANYQVGDIQEPCIPDSLDYLLTYDYQQPEFFSFGECVKENDSSNLSSDAYLSYLLEGGPSPPLGAFQMDNFKFMGDQGSSSSCQKDMDLFEMLSSQSSCSQRSNRSFT